MSEKLEKENVELKEQVKALSATLQELKDQIAHAETEKVEAIKAQNEELSKQLAAAKEVSKKLEDAKACMCNQFDQVKSERDTLQKQLEDLKVGQARSARLQVFRELGYSDEEAEAEVNELAALDDDTFTKVVSRFAKKNCGGDKNCMDKTLMSKSDVEIDVEVQEDAEAETKKITASVDVENPQSAVAKQVSAIASQFEKALTQKSKKESK